MKLTPLILAAAAALALTGPARADNTLYLTTLSGAAEAPPNASPGTGTARITIDDTAMTMRVEASFASLLEGTTAAHIHCCTALPGEGLAGVATMTPTFAGFPTGVTAGSYDQTFDMTLASSWNAAFITGHGGTTASAFVDLVAGLDSGSAYFNIHSSTVPSGEIRGFLITVVPEPETYALMLAGIGIVAVAVRRRAALSRR
jgi:hypothetical protein